MLRGAVQLRAGRLVGRLPVGEAQRVRAAARARAARRRAGQRASSPSSVSWSSSSPDVGAVGQAEVVGQGGVDRAGEVGAGPRGLARLDVGQRGLDHRPRRPRPARSAHCRGRRARRARRRAARRRPRRAAGGRPGRAPARGSRRRATSPPAWRRWPAGRAGRVRALFGARPNRASNSANSSSAFAVTFRRREEIRSIACCDDADDLAGLAVRAGREQQPEVVGEALLAGPLRHRAGGGSPPVERAAVEGAPRAVGALDPVEDGVVDVQLRVVVAGVVLEERRDDPVVGVDVPPRGAAVVPDPGVAGVLGQVGQPGVVARPDRVLDRLAELAPTPRRSPRRRRCGRRPPAPRTRCAAASPTSAR